MTGDKDKLLNEWNKLITTYSYVDKCLLKIYKRKRKWRGRGRGRGQ